MGSSSSSLTTALQLSSTTIALLSSGGILSLSLFDIPLLQSQPATRSLPSLRWLFSRGSHIFPTASLLSSALYTSLAYTSVPSPLRTLTTFLSPSSLPPKTAGYMAAALLCFSIAPWTAVVMVPAVNFELIKRNEELGGSRTARAAEAAEREGYVPGERSAVDSVYSKGEGNEFTDLSGPQERTKRDSTKGEDAQVRELLGWFGGLNFVRGCLIGAGGAVGLWAAVL